VVQSLLHKHEVLSSNSVSLKKRERERQWFTVTNHKSKPMARFLMDLEVLPIHKGEDNQNQ
jgi:hypothetical protein